MIAQNRKALHEYQILDSYKAGVVLSGSEVKAVREGKVDFDGSFVKFVQGKPILMNFYIGKYSRQSLTVEEADSRKDRLLLLNKYESQRLLGKVAQKGFSIAPLKIMSEHGLIKLEIALVKGKKLHEKKESLKKKQGEMYLKREEAGVKI